MYCLLCVMHSIVLAHLPSFVPQRLLLCTGNVPRVREFHSRQLDGRMATLKVHNVEQFTSADGDTVKTSGDRHGVRVNASARWKGRHSKSHGSAPYRPGQEQRRGSALHTTRARGPGQGADARTTARALGASCPVHNGTTWGLVPRPAPPRPALHRPAAPPVDAAPAPAPAPASMPRDVSEPSPIHLFSEGSCLMGLY